MLSIFKPAPHRARLPEAEIDPLYRRLRWQIFLGIFFGYAAYYLVRKTLRSPCRTGGAGLLSRRSGICAVGDLHRVRFSKFIMGSVSDRSNPRVFLPAGLILAAAVMLFMGFVPWATSSIAIMFVLLFLCGWFQGWDGRHADAPWFTGGHRKSVVELYRSGTVRITSGRASAAAVPAGDGWFNDWHAALYMPAFGAILVAIIAFALMRDTPQSCGLPPIEEYKTTTRMITARSTKKS